MAFFFSFLFFLITLLFLIIASITDLKARIVSNKFNYSMLALGLFLHAVQALVENNLQVLLFTILAVVATFICAFLLWKLGVWAGGDVKLFTALAALVPFNPALVPQLLGYAQGIFAPLSLPIFPLTLFIFSIFSVMPLGILLSIKGILKKKELKKRLSKELKQIALYAFFFSLAIAGFEQLFAKLQISAFLIVIPLLVLAFFPKKTQALLSMLAFLAGFYSSPALIIFSDFFWVFASLIAVSFFLKLFFVSRKEILIIEKKISKLKEGDIVAETIVECKGKVLRMQGIGFSETFKYLKNNNLAALLQALKPKGRILADRHSAAGVTLEELKELKALVRKKKLEDKIKVKLSTAFVPGVLVAFIILAFASDAFWRLLFP
ncbi:prepilin peptidase [archaeon]|nr:prepilin peptidase [archaeon]